MVLPTLDCLHLRLIYLTKLKTAETERFTEYSWIHFLVKRSLWEY